jgi:predicted kinase
MNKIYILIWIPASGKSTYIENNKEEWDIILSSDSLRKELLWDENIQSNNVLVFSTLFERLGKEVKKNQNNIFIDATNISFSDRRRLLNVIRNINKPKLKPW